MVKTISLVHYYITVADRQRNDLRSMSKGSMSYGVPNMHYPRPWYKSEKSEYFVTLQEN